MKHSGVELTPTGSVEAPSTNRSTVSSRLAAMRSSRWVLRGTTLLAGLAWVPAARADSTHKWIQMAMEGGRTTAMRALETFVGRNFGWGAELEFSSSLQRVVDLAFLALVALVVIVALRLRHAVVQRRLELARRMVEQGMEPAPSLIGGAGGNDLRKGLVLVCTGAGLLAASCLGEGRDASPMGLIPGFIGLGYLLSHRFAVRRRAPR